jgi:AcrR family transcriptional regulator
MADRPGGRSERIVRAIHTATKKLISEGLSPISFPVIAATALVNPTTLYRRWPSVNELLQEVALKELMNRRAVLPDTGSFRADLERWSVSVSVALRKPDHRRFLQVLATTGPRGAGAELMQADLHDASQLVNRGLDRGELAPTPDQIVDYVLAPQYVQALFGTASATNPSQAVEHLLTLAAQTLAGHRQVAISTYQSSSDSRRVVPGLGEADTSVN